MLVKYKPHLLKLAILMEEVLGKKGEIKNPSNPQYNIDAAHIYNVIKMYPDELINKNTMVAYNHVWKRLKQMKNKQC